MSAPTAVLAPSGIDGRAPRGAWWVAFRLQRTTLLIGLGVIVVMAGLVLWHRSAVLSLYATNGIVDPTACRAPNGMERTMSTTCVSLVQLQSELTAHWEQLRAVWLPLPGLIGAATGAALFSREFERRSQVFALTQSIGVLRWLGTKVVVGLVPMLAASIGVGFLFELTANAYGAASWTPLEAPFFSDFGFVPGAVLMVSFAFGVAVSTLLRQSLGAVLVSLVAALGLLWVLVFGYQYLGPAERHTTTAITESMFVPPNRSVFIESGFLDASGRELTVTYECGSYGGEVSAADYDRHFTGCFSGQGVTQKFVDYLPLSARAPLTWTVSGIWAALSAMFLAIGYALLRRRAS